jgi:hypothetical protein
MRSRHSYTRRLLAGTALAVLVLALSVGAPVATGAGSASGGPAGAARHFPCSGPNAAHQPCFFSTPNNNIHCQWIPTRKAVECELLSTHLAYRLRPTGSAQRIRMHLWRRGETLPAGPNTLVFPEALSCHGSSTKMTCNQNFGTGVFVLAPHGSHGA